MRIRDSQPDDAAALADLFTEAVHELGAAHYDARQRDAWAPRPPDTRAWAKRLQAPSLRTLIAQPDGPDHAPAGFIAYTDDGHIDLLFTAPAHARRGVAAALCREAERRLAALGVREVFTEASKTARPAFERWGFSVTEAQRVQRAGVVLVRYAMRKPLR